jgi:alcohol dehydrogenase class IV
MQLMQGEDRQARDDLAWVSLCGGLALANAGLGAVHGLAGVIGGVIPAAHGAICGALLGPVLQMNRARATSDAASRLRLVCEWLGQALGCAAETAPEALQRWSQAAGLADLRALGLRTEDHARVAEAARLSSSMKANPADLSHADLVQILQSA